MDEPIGDLEPVALPEASFDGAGSLYDALRHRRTIREIGPEAITLQQLADILWAAEGVNRAVGPFGTPGITAGSASNAQEVRIYVLMRNGAYLYEHDAHRLAPVAAGDFRHLAIGRGQQAREEGADAPVRLVYAADLERFLHAGFPEPGLFDPEVQKSYYFVDTGLVAQNVYLAAASLGLATWFHNCDKQGFSEAIGLGPDVRPVFGQTIGRPAGSRD